MKSHCDGEVWGLYVVEEGDNMYLITSADDGRVIITDGKAHKSLLEIPVKP
jgi:hypothetical protein